MKSQSPMAAVRVLIAAAGLAARVYADLPVHCVSHQIVGDWQFTLSPPSKTRTHCGHKTPDVETFQPVLLEGVAAGQTSKSVTLKKPDLASTKTGSGTWTMVYDEGFEVNVDGVSMFAFSRFDLVHEGLTKRNVSRCGETMVGWYSDKAHANFGCWVGKKVEAKAVFLSSHEDKAMRRLPKLTSAKPVARHTAGYDWPLTKQWHEMVALQINQKSLSWKAKAYPRWFGKTIREVNGMQGLMHGGVRGKMRSASTVSTFLQVSKGNKTNSSLPKAWDWGNARGKNWLEPVADQGSCGSCYAVSSVRMLTARHRIAIGDNSAEPFSVNFPMMCSEYNQGCNGGYGFLVGKWSEDVGLLPESCAPYDVDGSCQVKASCGGDKRWRAANHRYVGGFYGATNEGTMMTELYSNGPVTAGFEPSNDFMFYESGIYESGVDLKFHNPAMGEWERVDHGVLLVGWGEEKPGWSPGSSSGGGVSTTPTVKFWRLQNSWGEDWGEEGYFRFRRGINDSGVESICEAADVVADEKKGSMVASFVATP